MGLLACIATVAFSQCGCSSAADSGRVGGCDVVACWTQKTICFCPCPYCTDGGSPLRTLTVPSIRLRTSARSCSTRARSCRHSGRRVVNQEDAERQEYWAMSTQGSERGKWAAATRRGDFACSSRAGPSLAPGLPSSRARREPGSTCGLTSVRSSCSERACPLSTFATIARSSAIVGGSSVVGDGSNR